MRIIDSAFERAACSDIWNHAQVQGNHKYREYDPSESRRKQGPHLRHLVEDPEKRAHSKNCQRHDPQYFPPLGNRRSTMLKDIVLKSDWFGHLIGSRNRIVDVAENHQKQAFGASTIWNINAAI